MRSFRSAAAVVLAALLSLTSALPAQAATPAKSNNQVTLESGQGLDLATGQVLTAEQIGPLVAACSSTYICLYDSSATGVGPFVAVNNNATVNTCWPLAANYRNRAGYIWNHTPNRWLAYLNTGCTGTAGPLYPNHAGNMAGIWYRTIDALKRTSLTS